MCCNCMNSVLTEHNIDISEFSDEVFVNMQLLGKKGKVLPYSIPSVGPGADPGVQTISPQVTF